MLEELLQRLLGGGAPTNRLANAGMSQNVGGAGYSYGPGGQFTGGGPVGAPPAAFSPSQPPMAQPMPQPAPQPRSGGLASLFGRKSDDGKGEAITWLMKEGLDQGTAILLAGNKSALQSYLLQRSKGQEPQKPIEINGRLVDPTNYQVLADFSTPREQDAGFGRLQDIRKEIQGLPSYKNFAQAAPIYDTMVDAAKRDSKAADLNLIYGLGKIFDPGSVVREGEMTMVKDTASWPDWLIGSLNSVDGGARLQPATRNMILQEARSRIEAYKGMLDGDMTQYQRIAEHFGMDPALMMPPMPKLRDLPQIGGAPQPSGLPLPPQGTVSQMPRGPVQRIAPRVPPTTQTAPSEVIPWTEWMKR